MIVAWGERVALRPFQDPLSDAEVARIYSWSRDPEVARLSGGIPTELTLAEFAAHMRNEYPLSNPNRQAYFILTRAGELIGRCGCFAIDWAAREAELGIVIGEQTHWGCGYGRDSTTTLLYYLFETTALERVYLFTFDNNLRARRAFAACGFRVLGAARRFLPDIGEFDGVEMEITRREFYAARRLYTISIPEKVSHAQAEHF